MKYLSIIMRHIQINLWNTKKYSAEQNIQIIFNNACKLDIEILFHFVIIIWNI